MQENSTPTLYAPLLKTIAEVKQKLSDNEPLGRSYVRWFREVLRNIDTLRSWQREKDANCRNKVSYFLFEQELPLVLCQAIVAAGLDPAPVLYVWEAMLADRNGDLPETESSDQFMTPRDWLAARVLFRQWSAIAPDDTEVVEHLTIDQLVESLKPKPRGDLWKVWYDEYLETDEPFPFAKILDRWNGMSDDERAGWTPSDKVDQKSRDKARESVRSAINRRK